MDHDWRKLHPAIRKVWSVQAAIYGLVIVGSATLLVLLTPIPVIWLVAVLPVLGFFIWLATAGVGKRYDRWAFRFAPDALELRSGVWFRTVSAVPYHRIQQIDVEQGPIERRLGIVKLALKTASTASNGRVPGINADEAEGLREILVSFAARDDGV